MQYPLHELSIQDHMAFLEEEAKNEYAKIVLNYSGLVNVLMRDLDFISLLAKPKKGIYIGGQLILATGEEHIYYNKNGDAVIVSNSEKFLREPKALYNRRAAPLPITLMIQKGGQRFLSRCTTDFNRTNLTYIIEYVKLFLLNYFVENTVPNTVWLNDELNDHGHFLGHISTERLFGQYDSDVINRRYGVNYFIQNGQAAFIQEINTVLSLAGWKKIHITSENSKNLFIRIMEDRRIVNYHQTAIKEITQVKYDIELGLITDKEVIEHYAEL